MLHFIDADYSALCSDVCFIDSPPRLIRSAFMVKNCVHNCFPPCLNPPGCEFFIFFLKKLPVAFNSAETDLYPGVAKVRSIAEGREVGALVVFALDRRGLDFVTRCAYSLFLPFRLT